MEILRIILTIAGIGGACSAYFWLRRRGVFGCCIRISPTQVREVRTETRKDSA